MLKRISNLKVGHKLTMISVFFVIPDTLMLCLFLMNLNSSVRFAEWEKHGNAYQQPLQKLLQSIPEYLLAIQRRSTNAHQTEGPGLAEIEGAVDEAFDALDLVQARLGGQLQFTTEGLAKRNRARCNPVLLRRAWQELRAQAVGGEAAATSKLSRQLLDDVRAMITHAGDNSNLILDPDLDTYYLMDVTLLTLPEMQDRLASARAYVEELLSGGTNLNAAALQRVAVFAALLEQTDLNRALTSAQTAVNEDANFYGTSPSLQRELPLALERFESAQRAFISLLTRLSQKGAGPLSLSEFKQAGAFASAASHQLWSASIRELDILLDCRIGQFKSKRSLSLAVSAAAFVCAFLLVGFITRSISGPLQQQAAALVESNERLEEANRSLLSESIRVMELADEASSASKAKSEFLATISHELRTPLNGVLGFAQILRNAGLAPEHSESVLLIQQSGQSLLTIINNILDYVKLESGKVSLCPESFDLRELVREVIDTVADSASTRGIALSFEPHESLPGRILGDRLRIRQVLSNLVMNAVKFTEQGSVRIESALESSPGQDAESRLCFRIVDTGIGIPEDQQKNLFSGFCQLDGSMTRRYGGAGLGLALCRRIVSLMSGEIGVASQPGKGSIFWFAIPYVPATDAEAVSQQTLPSGAPTSPSMLPEGAKPSADSLSPARVLVVEDNAVNQKLALRLLKSLKCEVEVAANGQEAVQKAAEKHFDCIFMDCQMPVMDGYDATRAIRQSREELAGIHVPIIALTANTLPEDRLRCMESGMDDFMSKPLDLARFRDMLHRYSHKRGTSPESVEVPHQSA